MWSIFSRDSASSFHYEILEIVEEKRSTGIWKMHLAKKKQGGDDVSVFICDTKEMSSNQFDAAKAALKRVKTLRHPCMLLYLDSVENDKIVYLATEPVTPLLTWLQDSTLSSAHKTSTVSWGLLQVTKALSFLNNDGKLSHYNVCAASIYVTPGGEWKLGGLEYASNDLSSYPVKVISQLDVYNPPEKSDANKMRSSTQWSADMWGLGCLIWEVFNCPLDRSLSLQNTDKIPKSLESAYCALVGANPSSRPNPQEVIVRLMRKGQFFQNDLIETLLFLEEIQIKDATEKHKFFTNLVNRLDNIPDFICKNKVLPAIVNAHEFSDVGSIVLTPLFKIGKLLDDKEYQRYILPCVIKLFSSADRATRLKLLQQVESLAEHMTPQVVNDQVFMHLASGFVDTNPAIREESVKSILHLASKLNYNNLNVEVMKHFARLQAKDELGGIRTNTTVCLGKVASYIHPDVRQKCLISAFTRALRDPFPPARSAGIMGLAATQQYYSLQDVACRVLPSLCALTIDPEKHVRDSAFRVIKGFLSKLEKVSEDPTIREQMEAEISSASSAGHSQTATWAGWAVGALASKFYKTSAVKSLTQPGVSSPKEGEKSSSTSATPPVIGDNSVGKNVLNNVNVSPSDEWEGSDWQDIKVMGKKMLSTTETLQLEIPDDGDAWDDGVEWGSLETGLVDDVKITKEPTIPIRERGSTSSTSEWSQSSKIDTDEDFFASVNSGIGSSVMSRVPLKPVVVPSPMKRGVESAGSGWDDWSSLDAVNEMTKQSGDEARRQREEKRIQRQKEMEAKRAAKQGPMKLGAKKV